MSEVARGSGDTSHMHSQLTLVSAGCSQSGSGTSLGWARSAVQASSPRAHRPCQGSSSFSPPTMLNEQVLFPNLSPSPPEECRTFCLLPASFGGPCFLPVAPTMPLSSPSLLEHSEQSSPRSRHRLCGYRVNKQVKFFSGLNSRLYLISAFLADPLAGVVI